MNSELHITEPAHGTAEPIERPECHVLMKSGLTFRLDLSCSRVKFLKKTGGSIPVADHRGQTIVINCRDIKRISSLPISV
jgi:hypothetical protein